MKVFLVTNLNANQHYNLQLIENFSKYDNSAVITLTDDPEQAHIILFTTLGLDKQEILAIAKHTLVKEYVYKCFLLCDRDDPYPVLPGLYTALPRFSFASLNKWKKYFRSIFYFADHNPFIRKLRDEFTEQPVYLFSFAGSLTSTERKKLFSIPFNKPDILVRQTKSSTFWENFFWVSGIKVNNENEDYLVSYAQEILQSKFVLCPKGNGVNSYRFFEVMEAGRVPVLISDTYVLPDIPYNWDELIIRVKRSEIGDIENILRNNQHRYEQMALLNRKVYDECFHNKIAFVAAQLNGLQTKQPIKNHKAYSHFLAYWLRIFTTIYQVKQMAIKATNLLRKFR